MESLIELVATNGLEPVALLLILREVRRTQRTLVAIAQEVEGISDKEVTDSMSMVPHPITRRSTKSDD